RRRGDAVPDVDPVWGRTAPRAGEGHLTDAVSRLGAQPGRVSWAVAAPGVALRYRFRADGEHTPWFDVPPSSWRADRAALRCEGRSDRLVERSVQLLSDGDLSYRLRFA